MAVMSIHGICRELRNVTRLRQFLVASIIGCVVAFTFMIQHWHYHSTRLFYHPYFNYSLTDQEPFDPNQTCQIPRFHPFDESIWNYLKPVGPIKCSSRQPELVYIDRYSYLRFNHSELASFGYNVKSVTCTYQPIRRHDGQDDSYYLGESQLLKSHGVPLGDDFVIVTCNRQNFVGMNVPIYKRMHVHPGNISRKDLRSEPAINVVVFGVDSLSRLSFIRLLPKTYRYLTETMGAVVFRGMTKVGDNTFPNLCALLTGRELYGGLLPHPPTIKHYDNWPVIWRNFSDEGFATLLAEDLPEYSMFNYLTTGFYRQPTDHYLRPFWLAVSDSALLWSSAHLCLGKEPRHMYQVRYLMDFMAKYPRYFGFSWLAEVTHDYMARSAVLDDDFERTLRSMHESGALNSTLLFFMSDHGHRFSTIRETLVGRMEERLPFVSIVVPQRLKLAQPHIMSALRGNTGRLVSPFDLYPTLLDLLQYNKDASDLGDYTYRHGHSLFGPVPANRSCSDAGIPENFCTCGQEEEMPMSDPRVATSANAIVARLNSLLGSDDTIHKSCALLALSRVKSAHIMVPKSNIVQGGDRPVAISAGREVMTVVVEATPGFGLFEATVIRRGGEYEVSGDISRINMYRGQSDCIQDRTLRKYCYCNNL